MRFTRKLVRQQPWWLLVGVLAFFLLSSFTTAAPAQALIRRADEVQPAGASPAGGPSTNSPSAPAAGGAAQAVEASGPARWIAAGKSGIERLGENIARLRTNTEEKAAALRQKLVRAKDATVNAADRTAQFFKSAPARSKDAYFRSKEAIKDFSLKDIMSRLMGRWRTRDRPGETQIDPNFVWTDREIKANLARFKQVPPSFEEEAARRAKMIPRQRAGLRAIQEGVQVTPEMIKEEEEADARRQNHQKLMAEAMGEAEKEHPPSSSVASGAADLAGKAKQTLQEGAGSVEKVVDEAKSKLHVRKRSPAPGPASGWTPVSTLRYDGAGYNFVRRVGGPLYIYPVNLPGSGDGPYRWEDLPSSHQAQLKKSVENLKKAQANGWARAEHHMGVSPTQGSRNGFYRLPGFAKDEIIVKQRGNDFRFEYSQAGLLRSSRKTVPFSELPEHLKLYASNYVARHPDVPWASVLRRLRKRAPAGSSSGWQQVDSLRYPGAGYNIVRSRNKLHFYPVLPGSDRAVVPRTWEELHRAEQDELRASISKIDKAVKNGGRNAEQHIQVSQHIGDRNGLYTTQGRSAHTIAVLRKGDKYKFEYLKPGVMWDSRVRVPFEDLPSHLKTYVKSLVQGAPDLPWASAIGRLRLHKRAPPNQEPRVVNYPGETIRLMKARDGTYVFHMMPARMDQAPQVRSWSRLPDDVKAHIRRNMRNVYDVAHSRMSIAEARARQVRVAENYEDFNNVYAHPIRKAETIHIIPDSTHTYVFQRQVNGRLQAPVPYNQLPENLQRYLWSEDSIRSVISSLGGHRFGK